MKDIDICYGEYASKWGLSDFYEESKAKFMDALNSGEDFDTGWWGCKKEIRYARIVREDGHIMVEVSCNMDDLWDEDDLIYDALWEERKVDEELPDEIIESILEMAYGDIDDHTEVAETLPADASFDDIVAVIGKLEDEAEANNTDMYTRLRGIVAAEYDYWKGESAK